MQAGAGSPSGIALMAAAGIPSDAASPPRPGVGLRHPPVPYVASMQMVPLVCIVGSAVAQSLACGALHMHLAIA